MENSEGIQSEQENLDSIIHKIRQSIFKLEIELKEYDNIQTDEDLIEKRNYRTLLIHKINELKLMESRPYFGKVVLFNPFNDQFSLKQYYIGENYFNFNDSCLINNKNSEIGKLFISDNLNSYQENEKDYFLLLKQRFEIENERINSIHELYNAEFENLYDPNIRDLITHKSIENTNIKKANEVGLKQNLVIKFKYEKNLIVNGSYSSGKEYLLFKRISYLNEKFEKICSNNKLILVPNIECKKYLIKRHCDLEFSNLQILTFSDLLFETLKVYNIPVFSIENIEKDIVIEDITFYEFIYSNEFVNSLRFNLENQKNLLLEENWKELSAILLTKIGMPKIDLDILNLNNTIKNYSLLGDIKELNCKLKKELDELLNLKNGKEDFSIENEKLHCNNNLIDLKKRINEIEVKDALLSMKYEKYYLNQKVDFFQKLLKDLKNRETKINQRIVEIQSKILTHKELEYLKWGLLEKKMLKNTTPNIHKIVLYTLKEKYSFEADQIFKYINPINIYIHFIYSSLSRSLSLRKFDYISIQGFQNFNIFQFKLIRDISSYTAIYNLYGDLNQNLFGFKLNIDELVYLFGARKFEFNISYKSTERITHFINSTLLLENESISIIGDEVEIIAQENFKSKLSEIIQNKSRILIINNWIREENKWIIDVVNRVRDMNILGQLDLFDVFQVNGLKYDTVFVFDSDMDINEKYIAYSRAIEKLIIIR